ncbi:hypothetical protein ABZ281_41585, partial [Streptomyces sp. NPDC006265]
MSEQPAAGLYEAYLAGHSEPAVDGSHQAHRADAESVALGSHPAGSGARQAAPEPDLAAAQSAPPAENWLDPAEARPAAPFPDPPDSVEEPAGPAHMDTAFADDADPLVGPSRVDSAVADDADPSLGPGPDEATRGA